MATAPWGTVWGPVAVPTRASSVKEYTKVARNVDRASLVTGLRTNVRSTRGEYWVLAICSATSVMENTTPVKVNSAVGDGRQQGPGVVQVGREQALHAA